MISENLAHIRPLNRELIHRNISEQNAGLEYDEAITSINQSERQKDAPNE